MYKKYGLSVLKRIRSSVLFLKETRKEKA